MRTEKELNVIKAAYGVFFRYGYAKTTMVDLAKAAGLSRPALYLVFPGKDEIFQAVVEWMTEGLLVSIRESLRDDWGLEKKLMHALELSVAQPYDAVRANSDAVDLLSLDHVVPSIEDSYASLQNYLAELMSDEVERSGIALEASECARALLSAIRGFKLVAADGQDLRRMIAIQVAIIVAALGSDQRRCAA